MAKDRDIEVPEEGISDEDKEEKEKVKTKEIEVEMKQSYLDYAMSVIVGRALPDVRDGLKPVHRRVLYTMHKTGLTHNKPFKKSANVVGNCMARYHPHGDSSIYDTLVRMAQPFSLRYPLVNGQGNFGSIDGDSAAAMRYTEAKMTRLAEELMADIEKDTVDFVDNFDNSTQEPSVLPSRFPDLLVNGSSGIAVGMATNIPPHNMGEVCDAVSALLDEPEIEIQGLMEHVSGPDFPTGAIIKGTNGILSAYLTGKGKVLVRAKSHIEQTKNKESIIFTEIPFQVNKAVLLENIADLVRNKRIQNITDIRDESDRDGMRIVIELKTGANPEVVKNQLFKLTRLQDTFGINMLALVDNQPQTLNLKELLEHFIDHRKKVIVRRTQYDLAQAKDKEHILAGLLIALKNIDEVIEKIRQSKDIAEAQQTLMDDYELSEKQAKAILEMRLSRLASLERQKIQEDYDSTVKFIKELQSILDDPKKVIAIIKDDMEDLKSKYGDKRRSDIEEGEELDIDIEDMITPEDMIVSITHSGYIKRMDLDVYREQKRGGKGVIATGTKEKDFVEEVFIANTHDYVLFFSSIGKVHWLKVYQLPLCSKASKGTPIVNLIDIQKDERVTAYVPVKDFKDRYILMCTNNGIIKKVDARAFSNPRKGGIIAISLEEGSELIKTKLTDGKQNIIIATKNGMAVKFNEQDVREVGRAAKGVRAIRLKGGDEVIGMVVAKEDRTLLTVTDNGYGKRTRIDEYRLIKRGGSGVRNIICNQRNGKVASIKTVKETDGILLISQNSIAIRMAVRDISVIGRNTQGVRLMRLSEGDRTVAVAKVVGDEVPGDKP